MGIRTAFYGLATRTFSGLGYINRHALLRDIKHIYNALPQELRQEFHDLLKARKIIQPKHRHLAFLELCHEHLSKTVTEKRLDALVEDFKTRKGFLLANNDRKLTVMLPQMSLTFLKIVERIFPPGIRALLLAADVPLPFGKVLEMAKEAFPDTEKEDVKKGLRDLRGEGTVAMTVDGEYFCVEEEKKNQLLQSKSLYQLYGAEKFVSREGLGRRLQKGEIVEIFTADASVFVLRRTLEELVNHNRIMEVPGAKDAVYPFLSKEFDHAVQNGRIVYGLKDGKPFPIFASKASITDHHSEIFAHEIEYLIGDLKEKRKIEENEIDGFRAQLRAVFKLWQGSGVKGSVYHNFYLAHKIARTDGDRTLILIALLSVLPYSFLQTAKLEEAVPLQKEKVLGIIRNLKLARGLPFCIPKNDNHFIQNFMWYLIIFMGNLKGLELLILDKMKSLVFGTGEANPEEIKFLYARLAERFEIADVPDDLGNLIFRVENPDGFQEYEAKIKEATGMSLQEAKKYLADFARHLREELEILGVPRNAIHIYYHRKTESSTFEKVELRRHDHFENLWDLLQVRIVINCRQGRNEAEEEEKNLTYLRQAVEYLAEEYMHKHGLSSAHIDDYVRKPKKSGFQGMALRAMGPQKRKVEILLMTQRMFENEKFLRVRQMHFNYAIQRVLKTQKFDDYPHELIERLTGDPEHDYPLIENYLLTHWVWVFVAKPVAPGIKLSEHTKKNLINLVLERKIELQMKRLPANATPIDLAAGMITGKGGKQENAIAHYDGAEIYRFDLDEKTEETVVRPYDGKQGVLPNWGIGYRLNNGDVVFLNQSDSLFGGRMSEAATEALASCQKPAAKITLRRLTRDPALSGNIEQGKKEFSRRFSGISEDAIQRIAAQYKFLSPDDLYAAVGSGIIPLTEIEEIYKQVVINIESRGAEQFMKIRIPDRKGLIKFLFDVLLPNSSLLHLYSSVPYYLFGERRCEIVLKIDPLNMNVGNLTDRILRFIDSQSGRDFPAETFSLTIRVESTKDWNHIQELTSELEKEGISIVNINLPEINPGEIKEGTLEVEVPVDTYSDIQMLDLIVEELKKISGVTEVSWDL